MLIVADELIFTVKQNGAPPATVNEPLYPFSVNDTEPLVPGES